MPKRRLSSREKRQAIETIEQMPEVLNYIKVISNFLGVYDSAAAAKIANLTATDGAFFLNTTTKTIWGGYDDFNGGVDYYDELTPWDVVNWGYVKKKKSGFRASENLQITSEAIMQIVAQRLFIDIPQYTNEAAAIADGLPLHAAYFDTTKGAYTKRVTE